MKFLHWWRTNYVSITWFIIGWLAQACVFCIQRGDTLGAVIDLAFIFLNYKLMKESTK